MPVKVGQVVRISENPVPCETYWSYHMDEWMGKIVTVESVNKNTFHIVEDNPETNAYGDKWFFNILWAEPVEEDTPQNLTFSFDDLVGGTV